MAKQQADIICQQLEQNPPPHEDVQISSTSFQTSVTVIPPGIHGDRHVTTFKVEEGQLLSKQVVERTQNAEDTFKNQNSHFISTPENNQDDIPQTRTAVSGNLLGGTEVFPGKNNQYLFLASMMDWMDELKAESQCSLTEKKKRNAEMDLKLSIPYNEIWNMFSFLNFLFS